MTVPSNQIKVTFIIILPFNLVWYICDLFLFHLEIEGKGGWIIGGGQKLCWLPLKLLPPSLPTPIIFILFAAGKEFLISLNLNYCVCVCVTLKQNSNILPSSPLLLLKSVIYMYIVHTFNPLYNSAHYNSKILYNVILICREWLYCSKYLIFITANSV